MTVVEEVHQQTDVFVASLPQVLHAFAVRLAAVAAPIQRLNVGVLGHLDGVLGLVIPVLALFFRAGLVIVPYVGV